MYTERKVAFMNSMVSYMSEHHGVDLTRAVIIVKKYIHEIDVEDVTVQHVGADYFAIQILMAEKVIPYHAI